MVNASASAFRTAVLVVIVICAAVSVCALAGAMLADVAFGYSENVRHGYTSCGACHVAPGGGGALSAYGRSTVEDVQATFALAGESNPISGAVELPEWLALGGDARYVNVNVHGERDLHRKFLMQRDVELAVKIGNVTAGGSVGVYGEAKTREFRRNYVKVNAGDHVSVRAGRFSPAFGINVPDHTVPTRALLGLGQGSETYAGELALTSQWGEAIATATFGQDTEAHLSNGAGYDFWSEGQTGFVGRLAAFLGSSAQVGASYLGVSSFDDWRQVYGAHAIVGFTDQLWLLAELDRKFENGESMDIAMGRAGYELVHGLHVIGMGEFAGDYRAGGAALQWFPRPHLELLAEWKRSAQGNSYVFMFHHYL